MFNIGQCLKKGVTKDTTCKIVLNCTVLFTLNIFFVLQFTWSMPVKCLLTPSYQRPAEETPAVSYLVCMLYCSCIVKHFVLCKGRQPRSLPLSLLT